jgi:hypothetical protein
MYTIIYKATGIVDSVLERGNSIYPVCTNLEEFFPSTLMNAKLVCSRQWTLIQNYQPKQFFTDINAFIFKTCTELVLNTV